MPKRADTRRAYEAWLKNHILPRWGKCPLAELQARPLELWLESLPLAPKSKAHIRGVISILWDFAMRRGDMPMQPNPMELVTIKGATKRQQHPRSLTVEEFRKFVSHLEDPFRTMALLCCCLGLRISECLGLKWSDVDWMNGRIANCTIARVNPSSSSRWVLMYRCVPLHCPNSRHARRSDNRCCSRAHGIA